jgi:pyruvate/2-oxoglutarate dehydrogenase complex dihydrolipoamide acyltransferase (E2) component
MSFEFKLPEIGEGVTEGEIVKWLVKRGDKVKEDQPIVELMTDKATVEIASPRSGKIAQLLAKEGETVKIGKGLIVIDDDGASLAAVKEPVTAKPAPAPEPVRTKTEGGIPLASPAVRKMARELGIDLARIRGTGPSGRITAEDLRSPRPTPPIPSRPVATAPRGSEERIPLRGIRKKIAEHMVVSTHTAAHFTHVDEVDMTEVVSLRESLKSKAEIRGVKLTYLAFVVRAVSLALAEYPRLNSSLDDEKNEIVIKHYVNVGLAVNNKDDDLVVPVLKDADRKSIVQLASEISSLAERARNGQLTPADFQGGTFTITSVGSFGGIFATPIINHPEVAILGFYQITDRPVARSGQVVIRKMGHLSITLDHRVVDGAMGASFLSSVKRYLEDPKFMFNLLDA